MRLISDVFQSNLSGHKNLIDFLDSSIVPTAPGVHEVYLLMPYHKVSQVSSLLLVRCQIYI